MFLSRYKKSDSWLALASASFALPGLAAQASESGYQTEDIAISYHHMMYEESNGRMDIDVDHLSLLAPIGNEFEFKLDSIRDVISGASPVVNLLDSKGRPQQILQAGASVKDERDVLEGVLTHYGETQNLSLKLGHSIEDDYRSRYASINNKVFLNEKNTALNFAVAYNKDDVWNTYEPHVVPNALTEYHKRKKTDFLLGIEQVIDKNSFFSINLMHSHSSGFLSDLYRKSFVRDAAIINVPTDVFELFFNSSFAQQGILGQALRNFLMANGIVDLNSALNFINNSGLGLQLNNFINQTGLFTIRDLLALGGVFGDTRPSSRDQSILATSYSRFVERANAGLHIDYRFSHDSWDAHSHTLELKWKQNLGRDWVLTPSLRYYTQENANFYDVYFTHFPSSGYLSSDYRLAAFGSVSSKLELSKKINEHLSAHINYEYYDRNHAWALHDGKGSEIDDYHYQILALNMRYAF